MRIHCRYVRICDIFLFSDNIGDSTSEYDHQGRGRSFAHVRGNWASYVFIPVLVKDEVCFLDRFSAYVQKCFRYK